MKNRYEFVGGPLDGEVRYTDGGLLTYLDIPSPDVIGTCEPTVMTKGIAPYRSDVRTIERYKLERRINDGVEELRYVYKGKK